MKVAIIMGSQSDLDIMKDAVDTLDSLSIPYELTVVSAHRTPQRMMEYARTARSREISVIIAGAGGAAHLPGMVASMTSLPVIGVPILSRNSIDGWDSILSILQMPGGIPVATVALNGSKNAALLAARMLSVADSDIAQRLEEYQSELEQKVLQSVSDIKLQYPNDFDS